MRNDVGQQEAMQLPLATQMTCALMIPTRADRCRFSLVYTEERSLRGNRAVVMTSPSMIRCRKRPTLPINGIT
ncbi:MAG: hypothetical protein ACLULH_14895 [Bacteroides fragilis]